jgi:hypothetical protein
MAASASIEEDAHLRRGQGALRGVFQNLSHLLECDALTFHKLRDEPTVFQVLEQCRDRYSTTTEHASTTDALGITFYSGTRGPVDHSKYGITTEGNV